MESSTPRNTDSDKPTESVSPTTQDPSPQLADEPLAGTNQLPFVAWVVAIVVGVVCWSCLQAMIAIWPEVETQTKVLTVVDREASSSSAKVIASEPATSPRVTNTVPAQSDAPEQTTAAAPVTSVGVGESRTLVTKDTTLVSTVWTENLDANFFGLPINSTQRGLFLCFLAGTFGACLQVLLSITTYYGNRKFNKHWTMWYFIRPLIGGSLALLVVCVFRSGLVSTELDFNGTNPFQLVGVAGMVGLYSKQALDWLHDALGAVFKSATADEREDSLKKKG